MKFEEARICIAILSYPHIETECVISALRMYEYSKWKSAGRSYPKNEIEMIFVEGTSPARAHNKAVREFLGDSRDFRYLLIIGHDHIFKPDALQILFEADKDIIAGITTTRNKSMEQLKEPVRSTVSDWKDGHAVNLTREECLEKIIKEKGQPFKVPVIGDGLMLVKRKVFERMKAPWFYEPPIPEEEGYDMVQLANGTIGCDIIFCKNAEKAGFEIWAHPGIQYIHIGKYYSAVDYQVD